jgi:hypothetical protein
MKTLSTLRLLLLLLLLLLVLLRKGKARARGKLRLVAVVVKRAAVIVLLKVRATEQHRRNLLVSTCYQYISEHGSIQALQLLCCIR